MRISTRGRYALEALLYLALLPAGEFASTHSIAEHTGISERYLEQLFILLRKNDILHGVRGPHGGYLPGADTDKITVGSVLRAVEGSLMPVACVKEGNCPIEDGCGSRHTWNALYREINDCIDSITLADLVLAYRTDGAAEYAI